MCACVELPTPAEVVEGVVMVVAVCGCVVLCGAMLGLACMCVGACGCWGEILCAGVNGLGEQRVRGVRRVRASLGPRSIPIEGRPTPLALVEASMAVRLGVPAWALMGEFEKVAAWLVVSLMLLM